MCGICGVIKNQGISERDRDNVRSMNRALEHRGPDSDGYIDEDRVSVGMRRLSIIDVNGGSQPLHSEDGNISLVCNGEIYNFVELRAQLEKFGHIFSTKSDCETIIHAYEEYGLEDFISHVRGMFAFCLYDRRNNLVILARDRMGEKPMYIKNEHSDTFFSSELKSLLEAIPREERELDATSLYLYFHYGYVPGTRTMFKGIERLSPGEMMAVNVETGKTVRRLYWKKADSGLDTKDKTAAEGDPSAAVRSELESIDRIITRSDVPVGISLSGGIDSSLIAVLAARYSNRPLHAFSVGYPGYPNNDERAAAKELANELGLPYHDIEIDESMFIKDFPAMVAAMDEPISDIAAYGYYAVSRQARKDGVPVLLAGFGGDELFWGYEWVRRSVCYNDMKRSTLGKAALWLMLGIKWWKELARSPIASGRMIGQAALSDRAILYELSPQWRYARSNGRRIFNSDFIRQAEESSPYDAERRSLSDLNGLTATELISDLWLTANCIDLGDRMSMANSIELRLPLVDYRLYEIAAAIRRAWPRDHELGYKYWLIEAVRDILPSKITDRPKRGFTPPTGKWISDAVSSNRDSLLEGYLVKNGIVKRGCMASALDKMYGHEKFLYAALVFEVWAKKYL